MIVAHIIGIFILIVALMVANIWHKDKVNYLKSDYEGKDKIIDLLKLDIDKRIKSNIRLIVDVDNIRKKLKKFKIKYDISDDKVSNIINVSWICGDKQSLIDEDKPSKTSEKQ